ncbi:hypothetical protein [Deinococcus roseus]|uniref:Lipoprotein n=1 Tax=Deinococcus roseus TaxID=392414 RepID=A0ABQ2CT60_9DEIO|nr:hypothetical protein [Deinococcus roseus]GGJ18583.1 hypothetical protein GCM10008938_00840 [Deinococcus roseus]
MKKWLLPALGTLTLSACTISFVFGLTTNPTIKTEYRLANGQYVGCDDITPKGGGETLHMTQVRVNFSTNADLQKVTVRLDGEQTNGRDNDFVQTFNKADIDAVGNNFSVVFEADTAGDRLLPTEVNKEAIVVKAKIKVVTATGKLPGGFRAVVTATSTDGVTATRVSTQVIPVYQNCTVTEVTADSI